MKLRFNILSFFLLIGLTGYGQVNIDSLFYIAIEHSKIQEYSKAIEVAEKVLVLDPQRTDVMVFIANVNAWQGKYDRAKAIIEQAYQKNPRNNELYDSWLNMLLWNKEYGDLLNVIDLAEKNDYPNVYNISLKKTLAYKGLGRYSYALNYLDHNPSLLDSMTFRYLYNQLNELNRQNMVSAYYSFDFFENNSPTPQHFAFIDYGFKISRHTMVVRANYANRFNKEDVQGEIDYYHVLTNGHYLYANYGIGIKNELFPLHRIGLDYYLPFGKGFDASFGGRYLKYENSNAYILNGHIGKYISNMLITLKSYYAIIDEGNSLSAIANIRLFGKNLIDYWGVEAGYGNTSNERLVSSLPSEALWLKAYRLKFERNIRFLNANEINIAAGYSYEEYIKDNYRNRFTLELLLKHRF